MTPTEIDNLWTLYREFVNRCNQANMSMHVPEFLAYLERFKLTEDDTSRIVRFTNKPGYYEIGDTISVRLTDGRTAVYELTKFTKEAEAD